MIPTQLIEIRTKKEHWFHSYIDKPTEEIYTFWLYYVNPEKKQSISYTPKTVHSSPDEAYESILEFVFRCLDKKQDSIKYINNPCNCELISQSSQEAIIKKIGKNIPVKVNERIGSL